MVDLASVVRPGDGIIVGQGCAEPQALVEALVAQRSGLSGCRVFLGAGYSGIVAAEHADHLRLSSYCGIGRNRALVDAGALEILPVPYSRLGALIRSGAIRADVVFVQPSPPNARGEHSLGLAADYLVPALETCRAVVAEVNAQVPWIPAEWLLHSEDIDLMVESSRPPASPAQKPPTDLERAIARHAAALIPRGATLEFGIGALPDAVCALLKDRDDLCVHSGTVGDGLIGTTFRQVEAAMLTGTEPLFAHAAAHPHLRLRSSEYTHSAAVLDRIERFVAINSAVEVDVTGQVNGEVAKGSYVGAVGGALDFVRAANQSPGGLSILVLPASRIVEQLSGPVSVPRSEAGYVVTEHGAADLRGCTDAERGRRLAKIRS